MLFHKARDNQLEWILILCENESQAASHPTYCTFNLFQPGTAKEQIWSTAWVRFQTDGMFCSTPGLRGTYTWQEAKWSARAGWNSTQTCALVSMWSKELRESGSNKCRRQPSSSPKPTASSWQVTILSIGSVEAWRTTCCFLHSECA